MTESCRTQKQYKNISLIKYNFATSLLHQGTMVEWLVAHTCIMFSTVVGSTPLCGKSFSLDWIGSNQIRSDGMGLNWIAHIYWLLATTVESDLKSPTI